jgi:nicotinamide-nucleotide amidase
MASGTVARLGSDIAISATGIAGPGGGTEEKPVGTVYIGLCMASQHREQRCHFVGSRRQIQEKTAQTAMDMVRRALLSR